MTTKSSDEITRSDILFAMRTASGSGGSPEYITERVNHFRWAATQSDMPMMKHVRGRRTVSPATVHRHLKAMQREGLVQTGFEAGEYRVEREG